MGSRWLAAVLTACLSLAAHAQQREWTNIGTFEDGNATMFLDKASLQIKGAKRELWSKVERLDAREWQGRMVQTWMSQIEVDCAARTQRTRFEIGYGPDTKQVYRVDAATEAFPVVPDTVGEGRFNAICKLPAKGR